MKRLMAACAAAGVLLSGCVEDAAWRFDTENAASGVALARSVALARDTQQRAEERVVAALEAGEAPGGTRDRYEAAKRESQRAAAAVRLVDARLDRLGMTADEFFGRWKDELDRYHSGDLEREGRAHMKEVRGRYRAARGALEGARDRLKPVLMIGQDRVLALKHAAEAGEEPPPAQESGREAGALRAATAEAVEKCGAFIDAVPGTEGAAWVRPHTTDE